MHTSTHCYLQLSKPNPFLQGIFGCYTVCCDQSLRIQHVGFFNSLLKSIVLLKLCVDCLATISSTVSPATYVILSTSKRFVALCNLLQHPTASESPYVASIQRLVYDIARFKGVVKFLWIPEASSNEWIASSSSALTSTYQSNVVHTWTNTSSVWGPVSLDTG